MNELVVFLLEETGEQIMAMVNPEEVVLRRSAGVQRQKSLSGQLTSVDMSDNPLFFTGGGYTELELCLVFDVDLHPNPPASIRTITKKFWQLAENAPARGSYGSPSTVRVIWAKELNIPCVVTAISERFDRFRSTGEPCRSWMCMRLVRIHDDQVLPVSGATPETTALESASTSLLASLPPAPTPEILAGAQIEATHIVSDAASLTQIADQYYGDAHVWRVLAWFNNISDPLHIPAGTTLQIPALRVLEQFGQ